VKTSIETGAKAAGVRFISWEEILKNAPKKTLTSRNRYRFPEVRVEHTFSDSDENRRRRRNGKKVSAKNAAIPDAIFGLEYPGGSKPIYFAVEAELADVTVRVSDFEEQNSFLKKALTYRKLGAKDDGMPLYTQHLGITNLYILVLAPTYGKMEHMKEVILEITEDKGSDRFLFAAVPVHGFPYKAPPPPLLDYFNAPYSRAGREDFYINKP